MTDVYIIEQLAEQIERARAYMSWSCLRLDKEKGMSRYNKFSDFFGRNKKKETNLKTQQQKLPDVECFKWCRIIVDMQPMENLCDILRVTFLQN